MNTFVFVFVAAVAVLSKSASAYCTPNICLGGPVLTPITPYLPAPIVPTTTIVQTNTVTDSLVDVLQMLPVCNLLNQQLCPNLVGLPAASPLLYPPVFSSCNCGCGYNTILF